MRKLLLFVFPALFSSPLFAQETLPRYSIIQEGRFESLQSYDTTLQWYGVYLFQEPDTTWGWNTYLSDNTPHVLGVNYYYRIDSVEISITKEPVYTDSLGRGSTDSCYRYKTDRNLWSCFLIGSNKPMFTTGRKTFHSSKTSPNVFESLSAGESLYWEYETVITRVGDPYGHVQTTGTTKMTKEGIKSSHYKMYYNVSYLHSYQPLDLEESLNKNRAKGTPEYHITPKTYVFWMGRLNQDNHPELILWDGNNFYLWTTEYVRKTSGSKIFKDGTIYFNIEIAKPVVIPIPERAVSGFEF